MIKLGSHYVNRTFYVLFVLRIVSGPRVSLYSERPLNLFTTDRSKAVVPMLFLICLAL